MSHAYRSLLDDPEYKRKRRRDGWKFAGTFILALLLALTCVIGIGYFLARAMAPSKVLTLEACDRAVANLLESRDPIEIQRAGILLRELRCRVQQHLPAE